MTKLQAKVAEGHQVDLVLAVGSADSKPRALSAVGFPGRPAHRPRGRV